MDDLIIIDEELQMDIELQNKLDMACKEDGMEEISECIPPLNTFDGRQKRADSIIDLPPLACPDNMSPRRKTIFVNKATLSADPILEADKCIVMVIHEREGNNLAFFRLTKDTSWTYVVDETLRSLQDVVHVGNKFYVVKEMGTLFSFDITSDQSISDKQLVAADTLECFQKSVKTYVVVLDDNELLMVQRMVEFDDGGRWTNEARIFKLNFDMYKWIVTETLGHVALFLDDNFSISVKASNFSGCLPNCIYFQL
ncbi:putative F-box protein At4g17565 [Pyrus communis]|uniref:putative F-box protein At4g17565 n=1 Tax=Pyrus communis TaxID=23211 RepID=UPI0035C03FEB